MPFTPGSPFYNAIKTLSNDIHSIISQCVADNKIDITTIADVATQNQIWEALTYYLNQTTPSGKTRRQYFLELANNETNATEAYQLNLLRQQNVTEAISAENANMLTLTASVIRLMEFNDPKNYQWNYFATFELRNFYESLDKVLGHNTTTFHSNDVFSSENIKKIINPFDLLLSQLQGRYHQAGRAQKAAGFIFLAACAGALVTNFVPALAILSVFAPYALIAVALIALSVFIYKYDPRIVKPLQPLTTVEAASIPVRTSASNNGGTVVSKFQTKAEHQEQLNLAERNQDLRKRLQEQELRIKTHNERVSNLSQIPEHIDSIAHHTCTPYTKENLDAFEAKLNGQDKLLIVKTNMLDEYEERLRQTRAQNDGNPHSTAPAPATPSAHTASSQYTSFFSVNTLWRRFYPSSASQPMPPHK